MITDAQREFIAQITPRQLNDLTRRLRLYASHELRRKGLSAGYHTPSDLVSMAFERLFAAEHCCWGEDTPTVETLGVFLSRRIDDVVTMLRRRAARASRCKEFDSQTDMKVSDFVESSLSLTQIQEAWLELAMAESEDTARVVVEYLTGNTKPAGQAKKLELDINSVYRHRSKAMQLLRAVLKQQETDQ